MSDLGQLEMWRRALVEWIEVRADLTVGETEQFLDLLDKRIEQYQALVGSAQAFIEAFELAEGDYFNEAPESVYEAYERLLEALK